MNGPDNKIKPYYNNETVWARCCLSETIETARYWFII